MLDFQYAKSQSEEIPTTTNVKALKLKQIIAYYPNGNIYEIKNFVNDTCYIRDPNCNYDLVKVDTCAYGYYKQYHANGVLKILG